MNYGLWKRKMGIGIVGVSKKSKKTSSGHL